MSNVKQLLKEAKVELGRGDFEEARNLSLKVLKLDPDNYFAHVFLGKCFSMIPNSLYDSVEHYKKAIDINSQSLLAWKGLFLLFKDVTGIFPNVVSYDEYFTLCAKYADVLAEQGESQIELIDDIKKMRRDYQESEEQYLRHLVPGKDLSEKLGRYLLSSSYALDKLIKLLNKKEQDRIAQIVSKERLKFSTSDPSFQIKINSLAWEVYADSEVDQMYNQLVNIVDDDEKRAKLEEEWLKYRLRVLRSMPASMKPLYFEKVKTTIEDMVLVNHDSLDAWKLYFEWQDYSELDKIELKYILQFFKKFPNEPLAVILYSWASSKYSQYDKVQIQKVMTDETQADAKSEIGSATESSSAEESDEEGLKQEDVKALMDTPEEYVGLVEEDILLAMTENIKKAKTSILAHRIIVYYHLLSREYETALPTVKAEISLIAYNVKDLGYPFFNSKREFTIALGTVYTYVDTPKNHEAALSLFDKVLLEQPSNTEAKLGKGFIYMERENWTEAYELLLAVSSKYADRWDVLSEIGWCRVMLGQCEQAILDFKEVLKNIHGMDLRTQEFRALNYWRLAETYLNIQESEHVSEGFENVKLAYKILIQSIKALDGYAPSYCSLGKIYSNYYGDFSRAFRCHYRAFELDAGDIISAEYLARTYADATNWTLALEVSERLVKSEKSKKALRKVSWPYRILGVAYLEKQQDAESIQWFQLALRIDPTDVESWIGLGQSYLNCGRVEASLKVFERALDLDEHHSYALYYKAVCHSQLGEYEESLKLMYNLVGENPKTIPFKVSCATLISEYSKDLYSQGYLLKSISESQKAILLIDDINNNGGLQSQEVWIALFTCINNYLLVQSEIDEMPIELLLNIFQNVNIKKVASVDAIDRLSLNDIIDNTSSSSIEIASKLLILCAKYALYLTGEDISQATVGSSLWGNLGLAELNAYSLFDETEYRESAIMCFKKSIQFQSNYVESWFGLAVSTMDFNYRVSQHCFIKAMSLSPRDPTIIFAYAMLSLRCNDIDLATQLINKAQTISPAESSPWLGLALLNEKKNGSSNSVSLFSHAFVLSNGRSPSIQLLFAKSVLNSQIGSGIMDGDLSSIEQLTSVASALEQYFKKVPNNPFALQCALLCFERLYDFNGTDEICKKLLNILEERYEKTEDENELLHFALFKSHVARIELESGKYQSCLENADISQDLLNEYSYAYLTKAKLSNYLCLGLGNFFLNNLDKTFEYFQTLLGESKESGTIICLVSKILYEIGMEDSKEIALQELNEYLDENAGELKILLILTAMALIDDRECELKSLLKSLSGLPNSKWLLDKERSIPWLVNVIEKRIAKAEKSTMDKRSVFYFPNDNRVWGSLSKRIQHRIVCAGQNKVSTKQFSNLTAEIRSVSYLQRSIFLSPSNCKAIKTLESCFVNM
ncbi:uncharacterized protein HLK63_G09801 [Nakaseomyces glabratus]|nr:uncharacterized protein GW608_G09801 [Nakaseomyces glabratus]UCS25998.1 uncharacterized protein HLK63_G09801 [Nakaseomyces glabratus]UCS31228.1 uncharacterized protein HLK64_G09801 [Nakaseomyces glabratus]UCS36457.1 uncharacterized protein HLK62_G09801 [Nakaseomyces glabratus]